MLLNGKVGKSKFGQGSMITNTQIVRNHTLHQVQNVTTVKPQFTRAHGEKDRSRDTVKFTLIYT